MWGQNRMPFSGGKPGTVNGNDSGKPKGYPFWGETDIRSLEMGA